MDNDELDPRQQMRRDGYKAGISAEDNRKKREMKAVSVRKQAREESLNKRRNTRVTTLAEDEDFANQVGLRSNSGGEQTLDQLPYLLNMLQGSPKDQYEATVKFRKLLSIERNPPIELVIQAGVVPVFIDFLARSDFPLLQFEACWALTNIASGKSEHTRLVIENGAVGVLINLLDSTDDDVREQAVWCLGNIAGDSVNTRTFVLQSHIMTPLLAILGTETCKLSMLRTATWTLSNLCRGKPQPDWNAVSPCLSTLAILIYVKDDDVLTDSLWALSYLSDGPDDRIQQIINAGCARRVVELLLHHSPAVQVPALRCVGNIVTGNDMQTQTMLNCSVLSCLYSLLRSPKPNIRKEACWTISNITAGNRSQIKAVIDANIIPSLINILEVSQFFKTRKEAAWALSNLCSGGSPEQIRYVVSQGAIKPMCDHLIVADARITLVTLEGIENILKVGLEDSKATGTNEYAIKVDEAGGLDKINELQNHQNRDIHTKAGSILLKYFQGETKEDENIAPKAVGNAFAFGVAAPAGGQSSGFGGMGGASSGGGFSFGGPAAAGFGGPAVGMGMGGMGGMQPQQQQQQQQQGGGSGFAFGGQVDMSSHGMQQQQQVVQPQQQQQQQQFGQGGGGGFTFGGGAGFGAGGGFGGGRGFGQ